MAIASEAVPKSARRTIVTPRNLAIATTIGVVGGTLLFFDFLKGGQENPRPQERLEYNGGSGTQTDQGTVRPGRIRLRNYNER
ncbi:hypothetical protein TSTA_020080 [Talaromyces stipitatus ATCC 10500]|uniref:Uncharacterized protein n=1 Tax=Talaromyces stipitatus (strain ATCC 10500 / CBS 375.48 / QM 6759 / NRRL 1006) TaxID=441959 RepID=B8MER6_TALSN|nr:uncharacterized protein TSTA_020080 [Talaromyces stipitatus ATCC 10500]EED16949.1 hypothetical protein TSTA_020080 [Talaromyces stipitatus ATCC 10500]